MHFTLHNGCLSDGHGRNVDIPEMNQKNTAAGNGNSLMKAKIK